MLPLPVVRYLEFQSTLPSRRATNVIWCRKGAHEFQSTLPSRGATVDLLGLGGGALISIHAPLAGSDSALPFRAYALIIFQSTLPSRGATVRRSKSISMMSCISIHAPLAGSDAWEARTLLCPVYFNPRSPRGERHKAMEFNRDEAEFQSTLPSRGATYCRRLYSCMDI